MKRILTGTTIVLLCVIGVVMRPANAPAEGVACDLKVVATGFRDARGEAMIAIYGAESKWLKEGGSFRYTRLPIKNGKVVTVFKDVPFGTYAIAIYHDENKNNKMDANMVGIPREGGGISNNPGLRLGPPLWKDAKFSLNSATYTASIKIKYY